MMLAAAPPNIVLVDMDRLTGGDGPRKATPVVPDDPPKPVADADPRRWRREGPLPDSDGVHYDDPTAQEALAAVQRSFTRRAR